jgi:hypothetical protein
MRRRVFQYFTVVLLLVCIWTAYANVISDDTEVRAKARATVNAFAGCPDNEACPMQSMKGERGMITESIEYDLVKHGHFVVVCRRAYVIAGDYACNVTEGKGASLPMGSGTPSPSASAKK